MLLLSRLPHPPPIHIFRPKIIMFMVQTPFKVIIMKQNYGLVVIIRKENELFGLTE